jgi:uncharacterized membrane protein YkgB
MPAKQDHPEHHHHRKFNATQAVENVGVVIFILIGIAMLIGLLTAQGHLRLG